MVPWCSARPARRHCRSAPPRANVEDAALALRQWATEQDIEIGPDTNLPWWDGAAVPDYDWAISSLLQ
jgi:hypothetical protein